MSNNQTPVKFTYTLEGLMSVRRFYETRENALYNLKRARRSGSYPQTDQNGNPIEYSLKVSLLTGSDVSGWYNNRKINIRKANQYFGHRLAELLATIPETLGNQDHAKNFIKFYDVIHAECITKWGTNPNITHKEYCKIVNNFLEVNAEIAYCEHCQELKLESACDNAVNDECVCDDCYADVSRCGCCGEEFFPTEEEPEHFRNYRPVCTCCQENGTVPEDGEHWYPYDRLTEVDGEWHLEPPIEEEECEEDDDSNEDIRSYHSSKPQFIGEVYDNSETYVGFELEIKPICDDEYVLARTLKDKCKHLRCERDGSITGFEIITGYGAYPDIQKQMQDITTILQGNALGHDAGTGYGLHVSVSRNRNSDRNAEVEDKLFEIWNALENEQFFLKFTRRKPTGHCRKNKIFDNSKYDKSDKYQIVRIDGSRYEFRWFRSTCNLETLQACVLISYYSLLYARAIVDSGNDLNINWASMLEWIDNNHSEHSSVIKTYLASRENVNVRGLALPVVA